MENILTSKFDINKRGQVEDLTSADVEKFGLSQALTTEAAADYLSRLGGELSRDVLPASLASYRSRGSGPVYYMDPESGAIRYTPEDLRIWAGNVCTKNNKAFDLSRVLKVIPKNGVGSIE